MAWFDRHPSTQVDPQQKDKTSQQSETRLSPVPEKSTPPAEATSPSVQQGGAIDGKANPHSSPSDGAVTEQGFAFDHFSCRRYNGSVLCEVIVRNVQPATRDLRLWTELVNSRSYLAVDETGWQCLAQSIKFGALESERSNVDQELDTGVPIKVEIRFGCDLDKAENLTLVLVRDIDSKFVIKGAHLP